MITEVNRLCSDQQEVTATGASEATLDNVRQSPVADGRLHFIVQVTNEPKGGTSVKAEVQTSADNAAWETIADSGVVALADIPESGVLIDEVLTDNAKGKRYWRVLYTLAGSFSTAPTFTAGEFTEGAPKYRRIFTPGAGFEG